MSSSDIRTTYTKADEVANLRTWATELVSGKYRQGANCLIKRDHQTGIQSYCCLGVAATIFNAGLHTKEAVKAEFHTGITRWFSSNATSVETSIEVPEVMQACGLDETDLHYLAQMNDAEDASFQEIADVLNEWAYKKEAEQ